MVQHNLSPRSVFWYVFINNLSKLYLTSIQLYINQDSREMSQKELFL